MPRLCTYIVRTDSGFAPNPFWDVCTLAACTPNHQGSRLGTGDWIAGFLSKARGYRFLYAMKVDGVLDLDAYWRAPQFSAKKPDLRGTWKERCGDNIYSRNADGSWKQHRNRFHLGPEIQAQDTRFARVFFGSHFWYLGRNAAPAPARFAPLIGGCGARVNHDETLAAEFLAWVQTIRPLGVHAQPNDNPDLNDAEAATSTGNARSQG